MEESEKYQKLIESWLIEKNLDQLVDIKVLHDSKFKVKEDGLLGQVKKVSKPWNFIDKIPDFIVIIDEIKLDQLENEYGVNYRDLAYEQVINAISYNADNDKPITINPDIITYGGIIEKYGYDHYVAVREALRQIQEDNQGD